MIGKQVVVWAVLSLSVLSTIISTPMLAASTWTTFKSADITFDYPTTNGSPTIKKIKASPLANPDEKPDGVAPEHWELSFAKSSGKIWIIPTEEKGNKKFHDAYPPIDNAVKSLGPILQKKAASPKDIPFLPWGDWSSPFFAHVKYLNAKNANLVRFIAEYQIEPDVLSNDRLIYAAQGLTTDGKYYVSISMPVKASFLPEKSDLPKWSKDKIEKFNADYEKYTAAQKAKLEKLADTGYSPSLVELDKLVQSITVKK